MSDLNVGTSGTAPSPKKLRTEPKITMKHIDDAMQIERQYAENLFSRSENRVKTMLDQMFEERMQKALATIRPAQTQTPTTREAQQATFHDLTTQMEKLAAQYYSATGMKISVVRFAYDNGRVVASPLVYMA